MKALIEANGGKNGSSVSSKTSYLLAGEKPGPEKVKKAQDLGVEIIDEATFMEMLPGRVGSPESSATPTPPTVIGAGGQASLPSAPSASGPLPLTRPRVARDSVEPTLPGNDDGVLFEPTLF